MVKQDAPRVEPFPHPGDLPLTNALRPAGVWCLSSGQNRQGVESQSRLKEQTIKRLRQVMEKGLPSEAILARSLRELQHRKVSVGEARTEPGEQ
jgi:hypothetical protein